MIKETIIHNFRLTLKTNCFNDIVDKTTLRMRDIVRINVFYAIDFVDIVRAINEKLKSDNI